MPYLRFDDDDWADKWKQVCDEAEAKLTKPRRKTMPKSTKVPDTLKIKLVLEVDKELYDRIATAAKDAKLPGTIEDTLKTFCLQWFEGWKEQFDAMDNPQPVAVPPEPQGLLGSDGQPMGSA